MFRRDFELSDDLRDRYRAYSTFASNPVPLTQGNGRVAVDYANVTNRGLLGLQAEILEAQESIDLMVLAMKARCSSTKQLPCLLTQ